VIIEAVPPASAGDEPAVGAESDVSPEDDEEPDEPQATRMSVHRPARTSRAGAWVPGMSRPVCLRGEAAGSEPPRASVPPSVRSRECGRGRARPPRRAVAVRPGGAPLDQVRQRGGGPWRLEAGVTGRSGAHPVPGHDARLRKREEGPSRVLTGPRADHRAARSARWASELPRWSGANGGNERYRRIESGTADQS
jgi:hypothetical protein